MKVLKVHCGENLENSKWENFYAPIIGFEFKEGVLHKISVKETKLAANEIPADASSIKYDLVKVLETKTDPLKNLNGNCICTEIKGIEIKETFRKPNLNINLSQMRISGNGGCNSFSGQILNLDFSKIKFGPVAMTKKMCFEPNVENEFGMILNQIETYNVANSELNFYDANGKICSEF